MAATAVTITATTSDNRPIAVLQDLIAQRTKILRENTRDASIATMITALKSIRALTRKNKGGVKKVTTNPTPTLSITVTPCPALHLGFRDGNAHHAVVRDKTGTKHEDVKPWIKASIRANAPIFQITLSGDRVAAWPYQKRVSYIAADSLAEATRIVTARFANVASKGSGLARDALSLAMQQVSSKTAKYTSKRLAIAQSNVVVQSNTSGYASGSVSIAVYDNLNYATLALKGGEAAIPTALARAANSITGYLNNHISKHATSFFSPSATLPTPFPSSLFDPESKLLL